MVSSQQPAHADSQRYSLMPARPSSRPIPDCRTPPKGTAFERTLYWLTQTAADESGSVNSFFIHQQRRRRRACWLCEESGRTASAQFARNAHRLLRIA